MLDHVDDIIIQHEGVDRGRDEIRSTNVGGGRDIRKETYI